MRLRSVSLLLAVMLVGCGYLRSLFPHQAPLEEDKSIIFPQFFEHAPVKVGARDEPYELDGEMLRALTVASKDFLPSDDEDLPCPRRKEAQLYRVIRRGGIIFVYIYENHAYCGRQYPALDSGAKYAISTDGRILRRVLDGHPENPVGTSAPDDDGSWIRAEPGVPLTSDANGNTSQDEGTAPSQPTTPPPAPPPDTDGGSPLTGEGTSGGDSR